MFRQVSLTIVVLALSILTLPAFAQSDTQDKPFDIRSSAGDLHVGKDADAEKAGLPLYPGARPAEDKQNDPLNFGIVSESFGLELVVAKYETHDSPDKVLDFYRDKLKRYGKVLECHSHGPGDVNINGDKDGRTSNGRRELKCEEDSGPVIELKAGSEDNQHVVAVEPRDAVKGSTFSIIHLRARGKQGEI